MNWTVQKKSEVCTDIKITYRRVKDWEQWGLLKSDEHIDNSKTNTTLHKHHLLQAKERDAFIISIGDFYDAMQGKGDRRSSKDDLKDENKKTAYLNSLIHSGYNLLEPYKENLAIIGRGNHESGILKHNECDLIELLCDKLASSGSPVIDTGYRGWIRFMLERDTGGSRQSIKAYYTHGSGGGGPVTKGVIQASRKATYIRDADIVLQGHIHEQWLFPITQVALTDSGKEYSCEQMHVQLPTYKEEFIGKPGGFHHEKGGPPKPVGAWWIRLYYSTRTNRVEFEFIRADK